ncbi:ubiquitinyl hydrolase [Aureococcus anophagefferens]|nr:ubiquitinyl hydrolase [Aureococcus anophagefferens]
MLAVAGSGAAAASTLRPSSPLTDGDLEFLVQFDARVEGGVETIESSHFSEDNSAGVGLHNESSTCYLNALLQALFAVEPWRDAVLAWRYDEARDGREVRCIPLQFQRLFARLAQSGNASAVSARPLTVAFGWDAGQLRHQHDAAELLTLLLDALDATSLRDDARRVFGGTRVETLTPSAEEDRLDGDGALVKREASEPFRVVPLCVRAGGDDVGAAMGRAHGFESLEGDDAWHCDALGRKVPAIKRATMAAIPEVLLLGLSRVRFVDGARVKVEGPFAIPEHLDVGHWIHDGVEGATDYALRCVVDHRGTASGGHYVAHAARDGRWRRCDDARVGFLEPGDVDELLGRGASDDPRDGAACLVLYARNALPPRDEAFPPDSEMAAVAVEDAQRERHARVESIRKRATKLSVRRKTGKAHGPPVVLWASKAWTLDRAASAAFAKCGAGDAAGNAPALRRLRVWDPARKSGGKTFRSKDDTSSLEALGLAPAADLVLETRKRDDPPFGHFDPRAATLALRVWAGGDARLAAAALNNASDDDLEAAGLTCRDVRLSGTAQDSAEGIAGAVARSLGLEPADLEPANVARLRTDMDGVDALAVDRDARLFGGDELLVSGPEAPPVCEVVAALSRRRNALAVRVVLKAAAPGEAAPADAAPDREVTLEAAATWTLGDLKHAAIHLLDLKAADEYHVKPPERRAARRVDEAATLRDAGPGFFGVAALYDAKIAATRAHDSFSSGVRVVAHEQATVRDLRSLVAEKLSDMADGLVKPVPKRLANALSAFDTVDIRRVRLRERQPKSRYAGKQLRDTMTLKKAIPDMESDAGEVALQIDPKGFDDAGDEGTCAIVLLMRAGDNHVIEAVVDRRATVADFDAVAKRALGDDDAVVSVGRAGARGKLEVLDGDVPERQAVRRDFSRVLVDEHLARPLFDDDDMGTPKALIRVRPEDQAIR